RPAIWTASAPLAATPEARSFSRPTARASASANVRWSSTTRTDMGGARLAGTGLCWHLGLRVVDGLRYGWARRPDGQEARGKVMEWDPWTGRLLSSQGRGEGSGAPRPSYLPGKGRPSR